MGRFTEYSYLIDIKELPSRADTAILCPHLGETDREIIKAIRNTNRKNKRMLAKKAAKDKL